MKNWPVFTAVVLALLLGCNPQATVPPTTTPPTALPPEPTATPTVQTPSGAHLTPNPVETANPIYGGTLLRGYWIPRTFDGHQKAAYGPAAELPVFNQLVMFDINYKEAVPETIISDLAESWETSQDGTEITFHLHRGVKWHDGVSFTADDVLYSLDKMVDPSRSAISGWFPAYDHTEKLDDYTVRVHLKYASAGFMIALAQGESQIEALHLAGTDDQSAAFMIGTGPFILTDYIPLVQLKYKRNPDYFKEDKYGNQLPYLDGMVYYHLPFASAREMVVGRRLDLLDTVTGAANMDTYTFLKNGAPELEWQRQDRITGSEMFINLNRKPLNDIRVRRALALILNEEDLILGFSGDLMFGVTDTGILPPSYGLPREDVVKLLGWDKPYEERVAEAQQLIAEAGYADGFKLNLMSAEAGSKGHPGANLVFAEALRKYLKIDAEISSGIGTIELKKRLDAGNYDIYNTALDFVDPNQLSIYFGSGGYGNYAHYANSELDQMFSELDRILDPDLRRQAIWEIERVLLTDLPALPTGSFVPYFMNYYPQVRNLRWNTMWYSNVNRLEDVWLDESRRVK